MRGAGDFGQWYHACHPRLVAALTVAAGSVHVAEDVTAEAFVRAYERWDRVRAMASPEGWLYRVALNLLRRHGRRQALERELLRRNPPAEAAPEALDVWLWIAVRQLPDRQRTAVALRYVLDLPEADIAEAMGIARGTVSATLVAARRRLGDLLRRPDPDPDPAAVQEVR